MNDQYKGVSKQSFAWWDAGGLDIPQGTHAMIHEKFKAWEKRRGFSTESNFIGNPSKGNENKLKQVKKSLKKSESPTNFTPDIVSKQYASSSNAQRKINQFIIKNHLIIPSDYEFRINKINSGCYEITGTRK